MDLGDVRLARATVDGQELFVPSESGWAVLFDACQLDGLPLPMPDLLRRKVHTNAKYPELVSALGFAWGRVHFYELLRVDDDLYRVAIESVICDFCGHRAVVSATPGVQDIYWGAKDEKAACDRSFGLPGLSCHACGRLLERRRTVWQVN